MALDFPNSPLVGQLYPSPAIGGVPQWRWDGAEWMPVSGSASFDAGAVRFDGPQGLTSSQKAQARANIDALKKNYVANGAMMISQENGTTAGTTSGYYSADQFAYQPSTTGTMSIGQVASPTPGGSPNRIRATVTVADAVLDAADVVYVYQPIEGLRVADLKFGTVAAKTVTVQFGVKAPAGTYCVTLWNAAANRSYVAEYTIAAGEANTDVVKSVTIPGDQAGTWANNNTAGILVLWCLMAGANYQQAAGAWQAATKMGTANQFNFMGTNGNVFELFDVGLYEGSVAPAFQVPDYVPELALCHRYYWRRPYNAAAGANDHLGNLQAYGPASVWGKVLDLPVEMRAAPTVSVSSASHFAPTNPVGTPMAAFTSLGFVSGVKFIGIASSTNGSTGMTAGNASVVIFVNGATGAYIAANARM